MSLPRSVAGFFMQSEMPCINGQKVAKTSCINGQMIVKLPCINGQIVHIIVLVTLEVADEEKNKR